MDISHVGRIKLAIAFISTNLEIISVSRLTGKFFINMNQSKFDTFAPPRELQVSRSLFHNHTLDALILQIYPIFTTLAIVISNGVLLWKLLSKRRKTRADKIFIILCCSDTGVGLFSIPVISIPLFKWDVSAFDYMNHLIWIFSACFPYGFSWILVVIIALDRVLVVTKGQTYKGYISIKTLYWIIIFCLFFMLTIIILYMMKYRLFKRQSNVMVYTVLLTEFLFIVITILAYLYHFVPSKSRVIVKKKHGGCNFNKKLTMTVTCTYLCLLLFTLPQFVKQVIDLSGAIRDLRMIVNLEYWGAIIPYSNCYANAFIILYINRKNHE